MTIDEAATVLGVSGSKVRQLCQQRKLRHYRVGRKYVLDLADVEAYRESCRVDPVTTFRRTASAPRRTAVCPHFGD